MTPTPILPACLCGGSGALHMNYGFRLTCNGCWASTPRFEALEQAAACWTRMMTEPSAETQTVPIEPTRAMWAAGANAVVGYKSRHHDKVVEQVWNAMLTAAKEPNP